MATKRHKKSQKLESIGIASEKVSAPALFRAFVCLFVAIGMLHSHQLSLIVCDELCENFSAREEADG